MWTDDEHTKPLIELNKERARQCASWLLYESPPKLFKIAQ